MPAERAEPNNFKVDAQDTIQETTITKDADTELASVKCDDGGRIDEARTSEKNSDEKAALNWQPGKPAMPKPKKEKTREEIMRDVPSNLIPMFTMKNVLSRSFFP